jgi:hypothetical protein
MKKVLLTSSAFALFMIVFGCGDKKEYSAENDPVTKMYDSINRADSLKKWGPPKAIKFTEADDTTATLDGARITIEGYVGISTYVTQSSSSTTIKLWERDGQFRGDAISCFIGTGKDKNEMKPLRDDFKTDDVEITGNTNEKIIVGDYVRITGVFQKPYSEGFGTIEVQTIEKLETKPEYDYNGAAPVLININDTSGIYKQQNKLVVAEGYLELPMSVSVRDYIYFWLKPTQNSDNYVTADIQIGTAANRVEDLPDNYSASDIKVHDSKGNIVGKKKVRVYGVWNYSGIAVERIETL